MVENKRSKGVTALGILGIFFGILNLIVSILLIFGSASIYFWLFAIFWSLLTVAMGIGLLMLRKWARIVGLLLVAIRTVDIVVRSIFDINTMLIKSTATGTVIAAIGLTIFSIVIGSGIIYYLTRPKVKEQFK